MSLHPYKHHTFSLSDRWQEYLKAHYGKMPRFACWNLGIVLTIVGIAFITLQVIAGVSIPVLGLSIAGSGAILYSLSRIIPDYGSSYRNDVELLSDSITFYRIRTISGIVLTYIAFGVLFYTALVPILVFCFAANGLFFIYAFFYGGRFDQKLHKLQQNNKE